MQELFIDIYSSFVEFRCGTWSGSDPVRPMGHSPRTHEEIIANFRQTFPHATPRITDHRTEIQKFIARDALITAIAKTINHDLHEGHITGTKTPLASLPTTEQHIRQCIIAALSILNVQLPETLPIKTRNVSMPSWVAEAMQHS